MLRNSMRLGRSQLRRQVMVTILGLESSMILVGCSVHFLEEVSWLVRVVLRVSW